MVRKKSLGKRIWEKRALYWFVIPGILFYLLFRIYPLYFLQIAFRDFRVTRPLAASEWVGLTYFKEVFSSVGFTQALRNTLIINFYKLIFCFPAPIVLALMLNELRFTGFKRVAQTALYLPHFVSWVIIASIIHNFASVHGGLINQIRLNLGMDAYAFLTDKKLFRGLLVVSDIWKGMGYGSIIYLAAITAIDPELYEAAAIDGAGRFKRIWHITLSGIRPTIVTMLILRIGSMMGGSFDQINPLMNEQIQSVGDTLATYIYRTGISQTRFSFAAAAGIFNTVVAAILLFSADWFAKRMGERGIF